MEEAVYKYLQINGSFYMYTVFEGRMCFIIAFSALGAFSNRIVANHKQLFNFQMLF